MDTQFVHNQTYANLLPPAYIDQARALADFHEVGVFSGKLANDIGNSESRSSCRESTTPMHPQSRAALC
jgi:hypothetical protein